LNVWCKHCGKQGVNAGDDRIVITSEISGKKIKDAFHIDCFIEIAGENYVPRPTLDSKWKQEVYGEFKEELGEFKLDVSGVQIGSKNQSEKVVTFSDLQKAWKDVVSR